jgi:hypothetical protein
MKMNQPQKETLNAVVALLNSTLGDMSSRNADQIVAACVKILESIQ